MESLYDILEVSPNASPETIRAAYKSLVQRYHPDRNQDPASGERLKRMNVAYSVLSDPAQRQFYDQQIKGKQEKVSDEPKATSHAANEPPPDPSASPEPAPRPARAPIHPWRRLFARIIDYTCGGLLVGFGIRYEADVGFLSTNDVAGLLNPLIFATITCVAWVIIETFFLKTIGNTPGRALLGLRLVSQEAPPRYLARSFGVWLHGMWMGLPLFYIIGNLISYGRLKTTGSTRWDNAYGFRVEARPLSAERWAVLTLLMLGIFIVSAISQKLWPDVYENERRVAAAQDNAVASRSVSRSSQEQMTPKPAEQKPDPFAPGYQPPVDWSQFKPYPPSGNPSSSGVREQPVPEQTRLWLTRNGWYGEPGYDIQTEMAKKIDQDLAREGHDPLSRAYFDELDRRLQKAFAPQNTSSAVSTSTVVLDNSYPEQPEKRCWHKPVMTDEDYCACGISPPR